MPTFQDEVLTLRPRMLTLAVRLLGNADDAEDAVQDALLRLWQLSPVEVRNMDSLALVVVRNLCLDQLRRRHVAAPTDTLAEAADITNEAPDDRIERMMEKVRALPTLQQTILRLRHMEGRELSEIAALLGTNEVAVRQTLSRARRKIFMQMTIER